MKRIWAALLCIAIVIGTSVPVSAESGAEDDMSVQDLAENEEEGEPFPDLEENGAEDGAVATPATTVRAGGGGAGRPPVTEPEPDLWDVVDVCAGYDTIIVAQGSTPVFPEYSIMVLGNQDGERAEGFFMNLDWSGVSYDTSELGGQTVYAKVYPDREYYDSIDYPIKDDCYTVEFTLSVLKPERPDLLNSRMELAKKLVYSNGAYITRVTLKAYFPTKITGWASAVLSRSEDGGKSWINARDILDVTIREDYLSVFSLEDGKEYLFRLEVPGDGVVRGVSEAVLITADVSTLTVIVGHGGDRDGGDREEQPEPPPSEPPAVVPPGEQETPDNNNPPDNPETPAEPPATPTGPQSAPSGSKSRYASAQPGEQDITPSAENAVHMDVALQTDNDGQTGSAGFQPTAGQSRPLPEPPTGEQDSADSTTLSGKRLTALAENSESVAFVKDGIQLLFPSEILRGLGLKDDDLFTVVLQKPDKHSLFVGFYLGERHLSEQFPATFDVFFPYQPEPDTNADNLVCSDSSGSTVPARYDRESGQLAVSLDAGGEYSIKAAPLTAVQNPSQHTEPAAQEPQPSSAPKSDTNTVLPISAGVAALIGGPLFWRLRLRRIRFPR